jgi:lycopene beta-cyclase
MTAWRCLDVNPDIIITIVEASEQIGGDHTWSFNLSDIPEHLQDWIKPFIAYQWDRYDVIFPERKRQLGIPYCTGNSDTLRACVRPFIDAGRMKVRLGAKVDQMETGYERACVTLSSGEVISGKCVLDTRGFVPDPDTFLGYQKFVGRVIRTKNPHGLKYPIIMDATVEQLGGYRFVYCLPYTDHEVLVEDTYYTDGDELSENEVTSRLEDYITNKGWADHQLIRQEKGVLPITLAKNLKSYDITNTVPKIGIRGGFYHAVTGYSLPHAVRVAENLAFKIELWEQSFDAPTMNIVVSADQEMHHKSENFFRLLNRMLFRAAKPEERYKVLQRFYGLSEPLIRRFYAGELTWRDKLRILCGKPPVPISKALYNLSEKAFMNRERNRKPTNDA